MTDANPLQEILTTASRLWDQNQGPFRTVLCLSILRDLHRKLHAQRTQFLSEGQNSEIQMVEAWVDRIRNIRSATEFNQPLTALLDPACRFPKADRQLPAGLPESLTQKILRKDREWEKAIAAEAFRAGWSLWTLDLQVELRSAEKWHNQIIDQLWPTGVYLFVEPGDPGVTPPGIWHGRWFIMVSPDFKKPAIDSTAQLASAPEWNRVFPS